MNKNSLLLLCFVVLYTMHPTNATDCSTYKTCEACASANDGCGYCLKDKKCSTEKECASDIFLLNDSYNCPRVPDSNNLYTDKLGREIVLPLALVGAAYAKDPAACLKNTLPSAVFYRSVRVPCDSYNMSDFCTAYTAYDLQRKAIYIGFRGTDGNFETVAEVLGILKSKDDFLGIGKVFDYFNNGFFYLWNGGLGDQVKTLRSSFPTFEVNIVGHSLGASLASLCASYLVKFDLFAADRVKVVTFGQPRTGDVDYATWHDANLKFSYRLVHRHDPIPHLPPKFDDLMHHRFELWYDNEMTPGSTFTTCPYGDLGDQCANSQLIWYFDDHTHYFNIPVSTWGTNDCK